jgi:hypothetical protein
VVRSHASVLALAMRASAFAVALKPASGDHSGDPALRLRRAPDVAGERGGGYAQCVGAAERRGVGEQPGLMAGIHQCAAQRRKRARIALRSMGDDDVLHG